MQNDMLSHYLAQVKYASRADVNLIIDLESVRASPVRKPWFGMQLLFDGKMHVVTVLIKTPHAHQHHICGALASHRHSATGVRENERSSHQRRLAIGKHILDAITLTGTDRLLQQGAHVVARSER